MKRGLRPKAFLLVALAAAPYGFSPASVGARPVAAAPQTNTPGQETLTRDASGKVTVRFTKGQRIDVGNRTTGPIVVIGWDNDYIEATAVSDRGAEEVRAKFGFGPFGSTIFLKGDYADRDSGELGGPIEEIAKSTARVKERMDEFWERMQGPATQTKSDKRERDEEIRRERESERVHSGKKPREDASQAGTPASPPPLPPAPEVQSAYFNRPGEIFFEVKVPRSAEIDVIRVFRSEVLVSGVETPITVDGERSTIRIQKVAAAEVRTRSGNVEIDSVKGLTDVVTQTGGIQIKNAAGDVRAVSVSGRIEVQCAKGRVYASNTDGPITLSGVTGDVEATATYSNLKVSGRLRPDGRYYLKSMSGSVVMEAPDDIKDFSATLTSYRGGVESDFPLKGREATAGGSQEKRLSGRVGDGRTQLTLDSFDGIVRLVRVPAAALGECR